MEKEAAPKAHTEADPHIAPLSTGRKVARMVIERMLVPLISSGLLDLDEAIEILKRGTVSALSEIGPANHRMAAHLSRSRRWFQDYLRKIKDEKRESQPQKSNGSDPTQHIATPGVAYQFMLDVLLALSTAYPEALTLKTLRERLDRPMWDMDDQELIQRIEFYEKMGVLKIIHRDDSGLRIQATERVPNLPTRPGQLERLGERLSWVVPLALTHCSGKGDFGGIVAELSPQALDRARSRLREAVADIVADAVAETHKSNEPMESDVKVRVIIAIGATGENET